MKALKIIALVASIAAVAFAAIQYNEWNEQPEQAHELVAEERVDGVLNLTPKQMETTDLRVTEVGGKTLQVKRSLPARIVVNGERYAHVIPEASGIAREVRKNLGDSVQQGEVLAILESREVAEAKSAYLAAVRKLALAESTLEREEQLHARRVSAGADVIEARNARDQAAIETQLSSQKLLALGVPEDRIQGLPNAATADLRLYELIAPFAGSIVARDIAPGELIAAGSEPYVIADLSTVWVEIGVHANDIDKLHQGQEIWVRNPVNGQQSAAQVIYLSPIVDSETRAARVVAAMDNSEGNWRPGTFVRAEIAAEQIDAPVVVPRSAVQRIEGEDIVFVRCEDGLEPRSVELGVCDGEDVEVIQGLQAGECCATHNTFVLKSEMLKSEDDE